MLEEPLSSIEQWYRHVRGRLVAVLWVAAGSRAEAEEAADEAIARALEHWGDGAAERATFGWLVTVGTNVVRRTHRRAGLFRRVSQRLGSPLAAPDPDFSPEVMAAVAELPLRQRQAIALRYVLAMPVVEVADVMGVEPGTASRTLFDARAHLAATLREPLEPDAELAPDARGACP